MSLPPAYPSKALTLPLPIRDGIVLRTILCVTTYMLAVPQGHAEGCQRWRHAAQLLLGQAGIAVVSHQVRLALFCDAKLDIGAMDV